MWRLSGGRLVCDDLVQALDAILGEGRHAIVTDAVDAQAAVLSIESSYSQSSSSPSLLAT
jgi:hypothetical protein